MPRKPRFFLPHVPVHVVQRGNNRQAVFFDDGDYRAYLKWLREGCERYGCEIHAYVLMTNHIHLLASPQEKESISRMLQHVGRRYVPYINHTYGRTGTLWEGRFKASLVQEERYLLTCCRYIELNPVRAQMVQRPEMYRWSSYRCNALGAADPVVRPHELYLALGTDDAKRRRAYYELFRSHIEEQELEGIRSCLQTGTPLGNDQFREQIEQALKVKVGQTRRGRPKKQRRVHKGI